MHKIWKLYIENYSSYCVRTKVLTKSVVFQQKVGSPMGTNCAPLLADIFLYSYEADFIQSLLSTGKKKLASQFNFTYRYIDDVLSINNPDFDNYLGQMYPAELEIKDTTESNTSASYLDLLLSIESDGQLRTSLYDKRDDFNFNITNFPFLSSDIPSSPAYGVFISQFMRYTRACSSNECFILRAARLSSKLLGQGYVMERLKSSSGSFMGISSNIMMSPSPKCYMTFWDMTIYNDTLNWSDITPIWVSNIAQYFYFVSIVILTFEFLASKCIGIFLSLSCFYVWNMSAVHWKLFKLSCQNQSVDKV